MLTVTGTAEFADDGKTVKVRVIVQPHVPHEHDLLAAIADGGVAFHLPDMVSGQLVFDVEASAPSHDLFKDLEQTPSSAPSDATSVSDPLDHKTFMDAYKDCTDK